MSLSYPRIQRLLSILSPFLLGSILIFRFFDFVCSETPLIILRRTTGYKFGSERERERDNIVFFLLPRKSIVAADLRIHRRHF